MADRVLPDGRSVKDVVAHVAAWERWAEERLAARIEGRAPVSIPDWHAFEHDFNVRTDARWRGETWDVVAAEAAAARAAFWARVEQLDDQQLAKAGALISACGSKHYAEYLDQIAALVRRLGSS